MHLHIQHGIDLDKRGLRVDSTAAAVGTYPRSVTPTPRAAAVLAADAAIVHTQVGAIHAAITACSGARHSRRPRLPHHYYYGQSASSKGPGSPLISYRPIPFMCTIDA